MSESLTQAIQQLEATNASLITEVQSVRADAEAAAQEARQALMDAEAIVYGDALGDLQAILDVINGEVA